MVVDLNWLKQNLQLQMLSENELSALKCVEVLQYQVGDIILEQGEVGGGLFILYSGFISILSHRQDETVVLARDVSGALFAKHCLLDAQSTSNVEVAADDACIVYKLSHENFIRLMREHHKLAYAILFHMLNYQSDMIQKKEDQLFPFLLALKRKAEKLPLPVKLIPVIFIVAYTTAFFFKLLS